MKEIEKIIQAYDQVDWSTQKAALGTVVKVEGSAYRRIGARMFVLDNGQWVGGISGGCLEGDALRQAQKAILKNEPSIVVYDTTEDDPHQIGVGLGCNGRIEVLFSPIDGTDKANPIAFLKTITNRRESTLLLQVLNAPDLYTHLKKQFYTINNLKILAAETAITLGELQEGVNIAYRRRKSKVMELVNKEGDTFEILAELIRPKIKLVCVGDNYDVTAMLEVAQVLGWESHVYGKLRKLGKVVHHLAKEVHELAAFDELKIDEYTAIVLMSHDYQTDLKALLSIYKKKFPYLGLLGPKKRMQKMQAVFYEKNDGLRLEDLAFVHGPVGLDIGAESPEEIALSIASEIIAVFREREGGFLKKRRTSIHERIS